MNNIFSTLWYQFLLLDLAVTPRIPTLNEEVPLSTIIIVIGVFLFFLSFIIYLIYNSLKRK